MKTSKKILNYSFGLLFAVILFISFSAATDSKAIGAFMGFASMLVSIGVVKLPSGIAGTCAQVCDCNDQLMNTGQGCSVIMKVEKRPWIMNKVDSSNNLNYIDLTSLLDDTYFSGLINNADPLARLYPLPEIKNITDVRDKPVTYAFKDATEVFVRDGIRKFEGMFPPDSASPQLIAILEGERCAEPCKFSVDADGTIWGKISSDGTKLYPIIMDPQSVAAIFVKPTDTEPQMLGYQFNYHPSEKDCQLRGLPMSELAGGINPLDYDGLLDVKMTVVSASHGAGDIVVTLTDNYGNAVDAETVKGLTKTIGFSAANALYNKTGSANVAISTVVEGPQGTYTITPTVMPASGQHLQLNPTKVYYDFTQVQAVDILVSA